jgi:hypothetical protein
MRFEKNLKRIPPVRQLRSLPRNAMADRRAQNEEPRPDQNEKPAGLAGGLRALAATCREPRSDLPFRLAAVVFVLSIVRAAIGPIRL